MVMKVKFSVVQVSGGHQEDPKGPCTTYSGSGEPSTVTITTANNVTLPPIHLDKGATVQVCDDTGVATVRGESKTRPKGLGGKGGKRGKG
jgi:hypothetical protein